MNTSTMEEKIERLPNWAQSHIRRLEGRIKWLESREQEVGVGKESRLIITNFEAALATRDIEVFVRDRRVWLRIGPRQFQFQYDGDDREPGQAEWYAAVLRTALAIDQPVPLPKEG